jgi:uncharacterized membrane protein
VTAPVTDNSNSRLIAALAYLGGAISGVIVLAIEKQDPFVRFHAMQSTVTFLGVLVVNLIVVSLPVVGLVLSVPFVVGVIAIWIFMMVKAFRGERYKLPYAGDFAEHLMR